MMFNLLQPHRGSEIKPPTGFGRHYGTGNLSRIPADQTSTNAAFFGESLHKQETVMSSYRWLLLKATLDIRAPSALRHG